MFCVDEKTAISLWTGLIPPCRFHRGAEKHGFEYYRHGTRSLRRSGGSHRKDLGKTAARHTSEEFIGFLTHIVEKTPAAKEIYIVVDTCRSQTKTVQ